MRIIAMAVVVGFALTGPVIGPVEARATQQDSKSSNTYPPRPPSRWWTIDKYKTELKLSAEQSAEIETIVAVMIAGKKPLVARIGKKAIDVTTTAGGDSATT